jgi:hypothetical protein
MLMLLDAPPLLGTESRMSNGGFNTTASLPARVPAKHPSVTV